MHLGLYPNIIIIKLHNNIYIYAEMVELFLQSFKRPVIIYSYTNPIAWALAYFEALIYEINENKVDTT